MNTSSVSPHFGRLFPPTNNLRALRNLNRKKILNIALEGGLTSAGKLVAGFAVEDVFKLVSNSPFVSSAHIKKLQAGLLTKGCQEILSKALQNEGLTQALELLGRFAAEDGFQFLSNAVNVLKKFRL